MRSVGISVGNASSYVAAGKAGGIEILLNEYSTRNNPSMVAFTEQCRSIGVDAASNQFMNIKNTIYDLMVLLGRPYKDIQGTNYSFKLEEASDGQALVVVRHLGEERKFTITQVLAMLFTKLRGVAGDATDCVLSCPQFYNEVQKLALVQAALISGLNPLQVITDMEAVALNYAYYRTAREEPHKFIAFVNFGQASLQAIVAWLTPKEDVVRILAAESEQIGGRDLDRCLADHFIKQNNLNLTPKGQLKLMSACEKVKRLLSANANDIPINVESLISEDKDFTARIDRATFEDISKPIFQKVEDCLKRTLANAMVNFENYMAEVNKAKSAAEKSEASGDSEPMDVGESDTKPSSPKADESVPASPPPPTQKTEPEIIKADIQAIEVVGGSARVPAFKKLVQSVFNIAPSTTLNTDEAVARGCVLHCATLHPGMKVKREIKILNAEIFTKPSNLTCDKDSRRIELELIKSDRSYQQRTEARNNLEEFIYAERGKLSEGDAYLEALSASLDWICGDDGEDAPEEEYRHKLIELRKMRDSRMSQNKQADESSGKQQELNNGQQVPISQQAPDNSKQEPEPQHPTVQTDSNNGQSNVDNNNQAS